MGHWRGESLILMTLINHFLISLDRHQIQECCSHAIMIQVSLVEPDLSVPLHNTESSAPKSEPWLATAITIAEYYSCHISGNNNSTLSESQL